MALQWTNEKFAVGHGQMDETHREFIDLLNALEAAGDAEFPALFNALITHTEDHFAQESRLMEASAYPGRGEHEGEHRRLLAEVAQMQKRVAAGRLTMPRAFVRERLAEWFTWHASSMDAPLATHLRAKAPA